MSECVGSSPDLLTNLVSIVVFALPSESEISRVRISDFAFSTVVAIVASA